MDRFDSKQIQGLINISLRAGKEIMKIYRTLNLNTDLQYKIDDSPVTIADKKSNEIISNFLKNNYSNWPILSEESDKYFFKETDFFWVVDPLDGTKEFIKKDLYFTTNIGLCYKNKPILGFIYAPALNEFYYAMKGYGAFYSNLNIGFKLENFKKIHVSNRENSLIAVESKSHINTKNYELYLKNKNKIVKIVSMGSSLKGCLIAMGKADVCYRFNPTSKWDTCAMQIICEEAGAIFKQIDDTDMIYILNSKDYLNHKGFYIINNNKNKLL